MKNFMHVLFGFSVISMVPVVSGAVGTYYDANLYQSPQRYGTNRGGYYNTYGAGRGYDQGMQTMGTNKYGGQPVKKSDKKTADVKKQGLYLGASLTHELANWDFEMKTAGSKLRYDNLTWNVISGDGVYYFDSSVPVQLKVGARYGKQFGETSMVDDDISNGAYAFIDYDEGRLSGYAMSVGTSDDGTQYGFNAALGLTDFFTSGRVKLTPSIGYRYFKHELTTKNNSGLTMDVFVSNASQSIINCIVVGGETQCDPFVAVGPFYDSANNIIKDGEGIAYYNVGGRIKIPVLGSETQYDLSDIYIDIPAGATSADIDLGDTYYYSQVGTSHKYETIWHGPYIALDAEYAINNTNIINVGAEFGLPIYHSKGDQPYRVDWEHPISVEDKGSLGDAYHFGLNAMWSTAITDSTMFSLGMTYDYYSVKKADATTYINPSYYKSVVAGIESTIDYLDSLTPTAEFSAAQIAEQIALYQDALENAQAVVEGYSAMGWREEAKDEIESIYKSMGIRAGISVKF